MNSRDIDAPIRLTWDFGVAYVVLAAPTLWLSRPWAWDLPLFSEITGIILLPFLAMMAIYCPVLFVAALVRDYSSQKKALIRYSMALGVSVAILVLAWVLLDYQPLPSVFSAIAGLTAHLVLYHGIDRRANQISEVSKQAEK